MAYSMAECEQTHYDRLLAGATPYVILMAVILVSSTHGLHKEFNCCTCGSLGHFCAIQRPQVASAPPGPRVLPFIGNALNLPSSYPWETFSDWGGEWAPTAKSRRSYDAHNAVWTTLFGREFARYCARGQAHDLFGQAGRDAGLEGRCRDRYEERFQDLRRLLHQVMGTPASITKLIPVIEREVHRFLQRLLDAPPDQFTKNLRSSTVNATTLGFAYGYKVRDMDDPLVRLTESASAGNSWDSCRHTIRARSGLKGDRCLSTFVDGPEGMTGREEDLVKWAASGIVMGGTDTIISTITTFFLAMSLCPEAQREAQGLDAVVGLTTCQPLMTAIGSHASMLSSRRSCAGVQRRLLADTPYPRGLSLSPTSANQKQAPSTLPTELKIFPGGYCATKASTLTLIFNPKCFVTSETTSVEIDPRTCFGIGSLRRVRVTEGSPFLYFAITLAMYQISNVVNEYGTVLEPDSSIRQPSDPHQAPLRASSGADKSLNRRYRSSMLRVKDDFPITTETGWNKWPSRPGVPHFPTGAPCQFRGTGEPIGDLCHFKFGPIRSIT
ncbi:hypothetical protein EDB85DRAFT_1893055 [Lactarius pseudohatsudake]|nr:hypothetical protein EDB85DRAFT_1893055 [Lactarius pseudohatsudake]